MSRRALVIGNWKMNGAIASNEALVHDLCHHALVKASIDAGVEVAVCPSFVHVAMVSAELKRHTAGVQLGAQDISEHGNGALTGETSAAMLKELAVRFVLVGHSERRSLFGDTDARVDAKVKAALAAGLVPVICVGESLAQREAGNMQAIIEGQVAAVLDSVRSLHCSAYVLAYEPVWAIGTGKTASPEQAQEVHGLIRAQLRRANVAAAETVRLLYGGSVKANNALSLFGQPDIDGGLIGGAALVAQDFAAIVAAAAPKAV
jgi:triosephosphate isomerase (TIM)